MGLMSHLKSIVGGNTTISAKTVPAATTLIIPDDLSVIPLTGTATVTSISAPQWRRGGFIWLFQSDTGTTTLTNTPGTTTAGQMDLGGLDSSNNVLAPSDWIQLYLKTDGTFIRVMPVTNN